ncbi:hypothetical protein JCM8097_000587 [Rhodosporidiobolus ruineniae]
MTAAAAASAPASTASHPPSRPPRQHRWPAPHPDQHSKPHRHRPVTQQEEEHVYVLTLALSPSLHDPLNALRTRYFPSHRLKVPAHLTLFHALPHSRLADVVEDVKAVARRTRPFEVKTAEAFLLGKQGVAVAPGTGKNEGAKVHAELRERWKDFLSKQDSKNFHAHWTVQNKVDDEEEVKATFEEVKRWAKEEGATGTADGLELWRYEYGRWLPEAEFKFGG